MRHRHFLFLFLFSMLLVACGNEDGGDNGGPQPVPDAPSFLQITRGHNENTIEWPAVTGATSYNLYWTEVGLLKDSHVKLEDVESPFVHDGLNNGSVYSYFVTAENATGEGDPSQEREAMPFDGPCDDGSGDRFVDCGNGTITDTQTGLIWMKAGDCFDPLDYTDAQITAANLKSGDCGLSDFSQPGDWRLPTGTCPENMPELCELYELGTVVHIEGEFSTLIYNDEDCGFSNPAVFNAAADGCWSDGNPFTGLLSSPDGYWTSSESLANPNTYYRIHLNGAMGDRQPNEFWSVWAVRGGD